MEHRLDSLTTLATALLLALLGPIYEQQRDLVAAPLAPCHSPILPTMGTWRRGWRARRVVPGNASPNRRTRARRTDCNPSSTTATSHALSLPASYVDLYRQVVARHSPDKKYPLFETMAMGEAAVRLWRRTKEPAYLATAKRCFETASAGGEPDLRDFHLLMAFARLASS